MSKDYSWKAKESKRVIQAALDRWGNNVGIAFTGRKDSSVMMHMIMDVAKKSPEAFFIDHGLHFKESYKTLKKLTKKWKLQVYHEANKRLLNKLQEEEVLEKKAEILQKLRIRTISDVVKKYKWNALFTAVRWDENPARASEQYYKKQADHWRVHPMLHWKEQDIWDYIKSHKIPYNPLYDQGYRSIGAEPFTTKSEDDERSGRDQGKEEIMDRLRSLGYF
jgi:phosphoadenosine phosphosulfate reductase